MRKSESETTPYDGGKKSSYFGDEWNEIGDGEDVIDGGKSIYIRQTE